MEILHLAFLREQVAFVFCVVEFAVGNIRDAVVRALGFGAAVFSGLADDAPILGVVVGGSGDAFLYGMHVSRGKAEVPLDHSVGVPHAAGLAHCDHQRSEPHSEPERNRRFKILIKIVINVQKESRAEVAECEDHELQKQMVIVHADAVHHHAAVVVVFHATGVALRAVVHPGQFVVLTVLAESEVTVVFHFVVNYFARLEGIGEQEVVEGVFDSKVYLGISSRSDTEVIKGFM